MPLPQDPVLEKLLTIEFRQHASTLLAVEALSFIDFVLKLVLRCHTTKDEEFQALIKPGGKLRQPEFNALELLKFVGCSTKTYNFYESHILGNNSPVIRKFDLEEANILEHRDQIPVAEYALTQIRKLRKSFDPLEVERLTMQKLLAGGYGQYSSEDLNVLLQQGVSSKQRERLTIGYQVPLAFTEDDDDNDDSDR